MSPSRSTEDPPAFPAPDAPLNATSSNLPAPMLPIAIDAMGGDNAPDAIVEGARRAAAELDVPVVLVGRPDEVGPLRGDLDLI